MTLAINKTQYLTLVTSPTLIRDEMPAWDNHAPVAFIFSQRSAFWVYTFTQNAFS